jgi:hypothetical protein
VVTAIARELSAFIWAINREVAGSVLAGTRSDSRCLVERSGFVCPT